MEYFWIGSAACILTYLLVGVIFGIVVVWTNLARFHGGGFQYQRMVKHIAVCALFWPAVFLENAS